MTALEYILDGLEAELALERELGVRVIECDRRLLERPAAGVDCGTGETNGTGRTNGTIERTVATAPARATGGQCLDFVFLHDRPLAPAGAEMMDKIVAALGKTSETAPVVVSEPIPRAKAYVVLGGLALKKWFPGVSAAPGQWVATELSPNVLVTYSPAYILRFGAVTPTVQKIKKDMWTSIKSVLRRVQG